jgi:hypothetical protein
MDQKTGKGKNSWIRIRDEHPRSFFLELRNNFLGLKNTKKFFWDQGSGSF